MNGFFGASILALAAAAAARAGAGLRHLDETGFAVSGFDVVSRIDPAQSPVGRAQPGPLAGNAGSTAEHIGATLDFASAANRQRFLADPTALGPAHGGHRALGIARGGKVPGNPLLRRIVDERHSRTIPRIVAGCREDDSRGNLALSEGNRPMTEEDPAPTVAAPRFAPSAPVPG